MSVKKGNTVFLKGNDIKRVTHTITVNRRTGRLPGHPYLVMFGFVNRRVRHRMALILPDPRSATTVHNLPHDHPPLTSIFVCYCCCYKNGVATALVARCRHHRCCLTRATTPIWPSSPPMLPSMAPTMTPPTLACAGGAGRAKSPPLLTCCPLRSYVARVACAGCMHRGMRDAQRGDDEM